MPLIAVFPDGLHVRLKHSEALYELVIRLELMGRCSRAKEDGKHENETGYCMAICT